MVCSNKYLNVATLTNLFDLFYAIPLLTPTPVVSALLRSHSQQKDPLTPKIEDLMEEDLIELLQQTIVQLLRALLERAENRSIAEKMCAEIKIEPLRL